jgi:uncharacterized cupredoxin-like copper-binding protein
MIGRLLLAALTAGTLAVAACGGSSPSSNSGSGNSGSGSSSSAAQTVTFTETEFKIAMPTASLKAGNYTFDVENKGQFPHNLQIATPDGSVLGTTDTIQPGGSATLQVTLKAGTYPIKCTIDSHAARGMVGNLTVS